MSNILIIQNKQIICPALQHLLEGNGHTITTAVSLAAAEAGHDVGTFDLVISDLNVAAESDSSVTRLLAHYPLVPVLIMTEREHIEATVTVIQQGAADFIALPFNHDDLLLSVRRILEKNRLQRQNAALKSELAKNYPVAGIIGHCPAMQQLFAAIHAIAPTDAAVLLLGESGTGKELVARALHEYSERRDAPLITVNCAAIPEDMIDVELLGCEREGLIEAANGGTLFLDEISELPQSTQTRLLQVLEDSASRRIGSERPLRIDVRVIAATHRDLRQQVDEGRFHHALYDRLCTATLTLPPLRERGDDIIDLAHYMLAKTCKRLNRALMDFSPEALTAIRHYTWPGNVRELENAVERAVILHSNTVITADLLAIETGLTIGQRLALNDNMLRPANMSLDDYFLYFVLSNQERMSETELARRLGISRKSLWERRQRLGIPKTKRKKT